MSEVSSTVTGAHFAYLAARTRGDDHFLLELRAAAHAAGIPSIAICAEEASFMQILLKLVSARYVVEVGTLAGYSAISMARALGPDGRVDTIEFSAKHAAFARTWVAKSDVAGRVVVHEGKGVDVLPKIESGSADAAFLDADKISYPAYLDQAMRIVRPGGLIMVDNAFAFGELLSESPKDRETPAVKAFNDLIPTIAGLHAIIVPLGDGLWVGVRE